MRSLRYAYVLIHIEIRTNCYNRDFAVSLALKPRLRELESALLNRENMAYVRQQYLDFSINEISFEKRMGTAFF